MSDICRWCGSYSTRNCEWEEKTGNMPESAPCEFEDPFDPDPDYLREDRDERRRLERDDQVGPDDPR